MDQEQVQGEDSSMNNREDVVPEEEMVGQINELVTPRGEHDEFGDTSDKWHYNELVWNLTFNLKAQK